MRTPVIVKTAVLVALFAVIAAHGAKYVAVVETDKDLYHSPDFIVAADDRVEFAAPRRLGQVAGELLERRGLLAGGGVVTMDGAVHKSGLSLSKVVKSKNQSII